MARALRVIRALDLRPLDPGVSSKGVESFQELLDELGYGGLRDRSKANAKIIRRFQKENGLTSDLWDEWEWID